MATKKKRTGARRSADGRKRRPIQDRRDWLQRVEGIGELLRVNQPVDRDEEMSAVSYLVAKKQPSPAVLFEPARGFESSPIGARMLWNILGPSLKRIALTLEEPADMPAIELIRAMKDKLKRRIPPRGEMSRLAPRPLLMRSLKRFTPDQLPIPRHWP